MLYKLAKGSVPTYSDGQDPLVYLVSTTETIAQAGLRYLFSDGNCASAVTQFADDLRVLDSMVDWESWTRRCGTTRRTIPTGGGAGWPSSLSMSGSRLPC